MDKSYWKFLQRLFRARNKNIGNVFPNAPARYRSKKTGQLAEKEMKEVFNILRYSR